ncbi:sigma-70 family RNA polymerase sigma factor [Mycobacterium montefiorense]|uniref:sigma-70 family RNA polymerase sigma factor n=1 Tax=Mycobacterium montefiorense TaxID=154654 RepID=UPI000D5A08AF|nr:sigma-70 family RNA polymerase sigma factor [Mycobacterium montefiorense]
MTTRIGAISNGFAGEASSATPVTESAAGDAELRMRFEGEVIPLLSTLNHIAKQLTKNAADADDLVQETMLRAYSGFIARQSQIRTKAWFVRIMQNIWIDDYRRVQRRPIECLTGDVADWEWNARYRSASYARDAVESQVIATSADTHVREAFRALPDELRRALYYAYVEGLPHKDIAELESIPQGTVMSRLHRGRGQLRKLLTERLSSVYFAAHADDADVA